jgi:site-specific DNA-methyltransferase (adenine-specific)/modification methylase
MQIETIGAATIYLGDCREILPAIKKQISAIVSDPPYGINFVHGGGGTSGISHNLKPIHGDNEQFDPSFIFDGIGARVKNIALNRQTSDKQVVLFGADNFAQYLPSGGQWLVWDKACGAGANDSFVDAEFIWMNRRNPRNVYRQLWKGMLRSGEDNSNNSKRLHVSQKPVELLRWLIESARIGINKTICDPYMGSGSTGVAAVTSGRKFIGVEIDAENFAIALRRLEAAQRQSELMLVS